MNAPVRMIAIASAVFVTCLSGCSSSSEDGIARVAVSGKVTLDGQPLATGYVTFVPKGDGPSAGGEIQDGQYSIAAADGPSAGNYKVEIRSMAPTGRKVPNYDGAPGETVDETYDTVPANYNVRSELNVEIRSGSADTHDFALLGKLPVPPAAASKKSGRNR